MRKKLVLRSITQERVCEGAGVGKVKGSDGVYVKGSEAVRDK